METLSDDIYDLEAGLAIHPDDVKKFILKLIKDFGEVKVGIGSDRQELGDAIKQRAGEKLI